MSIRTSAPTPLRRANALGAAWMIAAMAGFAVEDAFVKALSQHLPIGQVLVMFGFGGAFVFGALALMTGQKLLSRDVASFPMRLRVLFEVGGRLFYILALALIPLSAATVILQATPIVVVAAAALVFGERVGWRRWAAILLGMAGVLVILRPGSDSFSVLSLLAVLGMLGFAGRDLASRAAPASLGTAVLGFYGFLAVVVAGGIFSLWSQVPFIAPDAAAVQFTAGAVASGVAAYSCLMKAMRTGEVSAVTPFRYVRLVFGLALGAVLFGERLTGFMLIGSAMIVLSGLFIIGRGSYAPAAMVRR
ncbi:DMT family transporter [Falsirhodobacter xinxiangensis]|uniref:DMT family transporter n=1 Tax=Falsirhodobacter xinxiangensis TaxID=2530049 RepID=UPI002482F8C8|nr:DMT family transporter [Rhodobacter xinxiangensis]